MAFMTIFERVAMEHGLLRGLEVCLQLKFGAEGLELVPGEEIVLADEPRAFARSVAALLGDEARRAELGRAARLRIVKQYSLGVFQASLREALADALR